MKRVWKLDRMRVFSVRDVSRLAWRVGDGSRMVSVADPLVGRSGATLPWDPVDVLLRPSVHHATVLSSGDSGLSLRDSLRITVRSLRRRHRRAP